VAAAATGARRSRRPGPATSRPRPSDSPSAPRNPSTRWSVPPNERADFLHEEGFEFAEVDLEERPLLFFAAIVDFFPSRSDATRARDRIASSFFGASTVRRGDVVAHYTDDPGTTKRRQVEKVVNRCLQG